MLEGFSGLVNRILFLHPRPLVQALLELSYPVETGAGVVGGEEADEKAGVPGVLEEPPAPSPVPQRLSQ